MGTPPIEAKAGPTIRDRNAQSSPQRIQRPQLFPIPGPQENRRAPCRAVANPDETTNRMECDDANKTGTFWEGKERAWVSATLLPATRFSILPLPHHCARRWPWMEGRRLLLHHLGLTASLANTRRCCSSSSGHTCFWAASWGPQLRALVVGRRGRHVGESPWCPPLLLTLIQFLVVAANMASLATLGALAAVPTVGRERDAFSCEGLRVRDCQVSWWAGLHGGRGSSLFKCGRQHLQVTGTVRSTERSAAVATSCAAFQGNGDEKVGYGGGVQPIQFDGGTDPPTVVFAPNRRIVAVGDLHGDFERTLWALQLAGVLSKDGQHRWIGGTSVLVQVGDVLDRGEDEIAILSLLAYLGKQARSTGGAVFQILGNHETMNVAGDFRYVAPGGFQEAETFAEYCELDHGGNWDAAFENWHKASLEFKKSRGVDFTGWLPIFNPIKIQKGIVARTKLLSPGGPLATQLASHGVVLKVNDWLFAHGGVLPHHVDYGLERMNKEVSLWMKMGNNRWGQPAQMPFIAVKGFDSIVWSRLYSKENFDGPHKKIQACGILAAALAATNCRGLIVGHTPQTIGANSKCDGRVWRIDVGMSSGVLHALPEVLEIIDDKVRILSVAEEFLQEDEESPQELRWKDKMEVQNYRM